MSVDTLSIARELKASKLPAAQAEAIASAIGYTVHENVATKSDLRELATSTKSDLRELESRIEGKLESLKSTMMLWFIGTNLTLAAIIIAALKL
jgi:hypothetical protein